MFFDVGATDFEQTPVYRRGFNTVILWVLEFVDRNLHENHENW